MAGEKQENPWPVPKFHFKVTIGDIGEVAFETIVLSHEGLTFEKT
jgi:hypothetical protein